MTADIEMLPLPTRLAASGLKSDIVNFAERLVEHNVKERDAEIEALRAEVRDAYAAADSKAGWEWKKRAEQAEARAERLAEALRELVALGHPRDPAIIAARAAQGDHDQEARNG